MLTLKKTAAAVLVFSSSAVFAGSMGPVCTPGNVTVPCARTAWDFGAQALYLETFTGSNTYLGSVINNTGAENYKTPADNWSWGFQIEGSYHFNTGNDVNLNWYHLDKSSDKVYSLGTTNVFEDKGYEYWAGNLSTSGSRKWDAVNLEFGQMVNFGEMINTRFHGGLAYVHLSSNAALNGNKYNESNVVVPASDSASLSLSAVGGRVGADNFYDWNNGFAVYAKGAAAIFAGQSKCTFLNSTGRTVFEAVNAVYSVSGSSNAIVPELEVKLGGTYSYAMAQGDLSVDLGWMWIDYINAQVTPKESSDFALTGPYVGLKWVGNVA